MTEKSKYQVLARRYRPQRFSDVIGQEAILQTLKNAIRRGSVAHAYLFSGSRGVGKTTLARLFAKALNCAALTEEGEPCNSCPSCLDIFSSQSLDVIEIDGASNRGIDDIRQINETVGFAPSLGKYKIYIIDEVHMLTKEAFNALLKTLEEPPEQVKFFFATTEAHKVLPTILSRCQRFDLGRLSPPQIIAKLESIAKDLSRTVEIEALHLIARSVDGSLRDAESLFDQVLCFSNEAVSAADVRNVLGLACAELFFSFDKAFSESRLSYAFELVEQLFQEGKDVGHFLEQLIEHFRHLTVCKTMSVSALQMSSELSARYAASAAFYTQQQCLSALDTLLKTDAELLRSSSPRTALELTLLQILRTKNRIPIEALVRRLSELEESILHTNPKEIASPPEPIPPIPEPAVAAELTHSQEPSEKAIADPKDTGERVIETRAEAPIPISETPLATLEVNEVRPPPHLAEKSNTSSKPIEAIQQQSSAEPSELNQKSSEASKHPSHYETLIRFAAVELEGTVKK